MLPVKACIGVWRIPRPLRWGFMTSAQIAIDLRFTKSRTSPGTKAGACLFVRRHHFGPGGIAKWPTHLTLV